MQNDELTTRPGVRVHAKVVIDGIHQRYTRQIAMLVQENAELSAALDASRDDRDEIAAKLEALTGDQVDTRGE